MNSDQIIISVMSTAVQIDTDLLRYVTSKADKLSGVPTLMNLNPPKNGS